MRLITLSILSIFTVFTFAQTVNIGAGAEIRVAGVNAATSNDAILDIDGDLVIENTGQLDADRDGRFFIGGDITYQGNAYARARGVMTLDGTTAQEIVNTGGFFNA